MKSAPRLCLLPLVLVMALAVPLGCASSGGPGTPGGVSAGTDPLDPNLPDPAATGGGGISAGERAQSAVEGMLMGAIIGGQLGPIGAAVGGVTALVYGAVTGKVPFQPGGGSGGMSGPGGSGAEAQREAELEHEIETELARQDSLEEAIEAELRRQEELLQQIERDDAVRTAEESKEDVSEGELIARADPRAAPTAPRDRDLPLSIFEEENRTIAKGRWDNDKPIPVLVRSLDADRDGSPEEIRYHDSKTGAILRKEEDKDYDGSIDSWTRYDAGIVSEIQRDGNADGKPDEWQRYGRDGRMATRDVDRDYDGRRDAFYRFESGSLVEERHDGNGDGQPDRIVFYEGRRIVRTEEDLKGDGRTDTWTHFGTAGDREVIERVERDTTGDGSADTFEIYEQVAGKPTLKQRDEDKNGDGQVDIKSLYENGKLKSREISDPALLPL